MKFVTKAALRVAKAVSSGRTRRTAPPRCWTKTIVEGELRFSARVRHDLDRGVREIVEVERFPVGYHLSRVGEEGIEGSLNASVGNRTSDLAERLTELPERLQNPHAFLRIPAYTPRQRSPPLDHGRKPASPAPRAQSTSRPRKSPHPEPTASQSRHCFKTSRAAAIGYIENTAATSRTNGMQCELEGGHDAEIAASSAESPEQIRVLVGFRA